MTLVSSGLAASFDRDELHAVLAHEMGHVLADHVGFTTSFELVKLIMAKVFRGAPLAGLPMMALYLALLEWSRAAELTADRASAARDRRPAPDVPHLDAHGGRPCARAEPRRVHHPGHRVRGGGGSVRGYSRFWEEIGATHPFPVRRVRELVEWVASGEFDRQRSGGYLRRGQAPPPSAEFDAAFKYYKGRFSKMVERVGGGVQQVVNRFATWLDTDGPNGDVAGDAGFEG